MEVVLEILNALLPFLLAFLAWVMRKYVQDVVRDMDRKIEERTRPIQKDANGGWSLPDSIKLMHQMVAKVDEVHSRVTGVATDVAHLRGRFDQHIEEKKW